MAQRLSSSGTLPSSLSSNWVSNDHTHRCRCWRGWSSWATLKETDGWINATIVAVADNCILRKRLSWTIVKQQSCGEGIAATLRLCTTALLPLLTEKLLCLTGMVARCSEEASCSWVGIGAAGIAADTTIVSAKYVAICGRVAAAWILVYGVGVEGVGVEVVWGDSDFLLVRLVMEVVDVIFQRSIRVEFAL